eukprot:1406572-Rhodomonas_salina.1
MGTGSKRAYSSAAPHLSRARPANTVRTRHGASKYSRARKCVWCWAPGQIRTWPRQSVGG